MQSRWATGLLIVVLIMSAGIIPSFAAPALELTLVNLTSPVATGDRVVLTIKTLPGAECVATQNARGRQNSMPQKAAGGDGIVTWNWRAAVSGTHYITVECVQGDRRALLSLVLVVQ